MSYYWVFQNKTFAEERAGGFLWAPVRNRSGQTPHHWATVPHVKAGDTIFCSVEQTIAAVAVAATDAYSSPRPEFRSDVSWESDGYRVDVQYEDVQPRLRIAAVRDELVPLLPPKYSPLQADGPQQDRRQPARG
jgi:hypothetical protein